MADKKPIVVVAGATGRAGRLIVAELRKRKYPVRAMIIRPFDPPEPEGLTGSGIEIREGSLESAEVLAGTLKGAGYVISAIGSTKPMSGSEFEKIDIAGNTALARAAKAAGVKRFVVISSIGAGNSRDAMTCVFRLMMGQVIKAKSAMEEKIRETGVDYTIIRPGGYTARPLSGEIAISEGGKISGLVNRELIAKVCVDAIANAAMKNRTFEVVDRSALKKGREQFLIEV